MFADYTSLVVAEYHRKKVGNTLSLRLVHPTPAKLKEECKTVCNERFQNKDYQILKTFFGQAEDIKSCLQAIDKCDIDKFRPLLNFLKQKTNDPDEKNIELLAWLIDFNPRPFELGRRYSEAKSGASDFDARRQDEKVKEAPIENEDDNTGRSLKNDENSGEEGSLPIHVTYSDAEKTKDDIPQTKTSLLIFRVIGSSLLLAIIGFAVTTIFWPKSKRPQVFALTGKEACMFWAGDYYQQISCNQKLGDTLIIALDSVKLNHFKKITQPDTITSNAIGNVWYVKLNGNIEFYTADGYHPVHRDLRLRPVTVYIINKYVRAGGHPE